MLRAVQLAALPAVETSPAHCPHTVPMLAATRRGSSNVLQLTRLVPGYLIALASAPIKNLDMLLPPASPDLETLRGRWPLSSYFLDQSDHLDALRDQACPSRMHRRQKLAAVIIDPGEF